MYNVDSTEYDASGTAEFTDVVRYAFSSTQCARIEVYSAAL
jgi:hypothetical protein